MPCTSPYERCARKVCKSGTESDKRRARTGAQMGEGTRCGGGARVVGGHLPRQARQLVLERFPVHAAPLPRWGKPVKFVILCRVLSGWRSTRDRHQRGERSGRCWRAVLPCAHWWRGARCRPMPASRWPRALTPSFPAASSSSTTGSLSLHGASARRSSALLPQEARPSHGNKAGGERQRAADARVRSAELVHSRARA